MFIFFACLKPQKPYKFDVLFRLKKSLCQIAETRVNQTNQFVRKIKLDNKHCDVSELRATIEIYVGNQKHPKLSRRTHGFSHMF